MGSYTFRWPHAANEVFVTGTFDDWGKTVQLERQEESFQKTVALPATDEKVYYKFVVDGLWTTDSSAPEENDGSNNINNVLNPEEIQAENQNENENENSATTAAVMAGVTPDSTTAAMAANVPKKTDPIAASVPGGFPETPGQEAESFSVNPIPASSGAGNPISLAPGEKVPDPSTFNSNTVNSTVRTDPAGYEQDASHSLAGASSSYGGSGDGSLAGLASASNPVAAANRRPSKMDPDSGLPVEGESVGLTDTGVPIESSAAPESTTAGLASQAPLRSEDQKRSAVSGGTAAAAAGGGGGIAGGAGGVETARDVPSVVQNSLSEAHQDPEAAASEAAVREKKEIEDELRQKVGVDRSPGTPAPTSAADTTGATGPSSGYGTSAGNTSSAAAPAAATGLAAGGVTGGTAAGAAAPSGTTSGTTSGVAPGTATTTSGNTSGVAPGTATTSEDAPVASGKGTKSQPLSPRSESPTQPAGATGTEGTSSGYGTGAAAAGGAAGAGGLAGAGGAAGAAGSKGEGAAGGLASKAQGAAADPKAAGSSAADKANPSGLKDNAADTAKQQANGDQTARKDYADKARQEASDLSKDQKKKNRASGLFQKLKEKLK